MQSSYFPFLTLSRKEIETFCFDFSQLTICVNNSSRFYIHSSTQRPSSFFTIKRLVSIPILKWLLKNGILGFTCVFSEPFGMISVWGRKLVISLWRFLLNKKFRFFSLFCKYALRFNVSAIILRQRIVEKKLTQNTKTKLRVKKTNKFSVFYTRHFYVIVSPRVHLLCPVSRVRTSNNWRERLKKELRDGEEKYYFM